MKGSTTKTFKFIVRITAIKLDAANLKETFLRLKLRG